MAYYERTVDEKRFTLWVAPVNRAWKATVAFQEPSSKLQSGTFAKEEPVISASGKSEEGAIEACELELRKFPG